jgi:hypothetical protein
MTTSLLVIFLFLFREDSPTSDQYVALKITCKNDLGDVL